MKINPCLPLLVFSIAMASGCSPAATNNDVAAASESATPVAATPEPALPVAAVAEVAPRVSQLPQVVVHKSATCGCCSAWAEHITQAGYPVEVFNEEDLNPLKLALGVPADMASCHTAIVEGYFIEGHVPAADISRLLMERPDARGLAVGGMPVGSPGMEVPSGEVQPYTVYLVNKDGTSTPYSEYGR